MSIFVKGANNNRKYQSKNVDSTKMLSLSECLKFL